MSESEAFWKGKRVLVTGGAGFLGSYVVEKLRARGCEEVTIVRRADYDLTREENVERIYEDARPDIVIHLAATVGGIGANRAEPGRFYYENAAMGLHLIEHARRRDVEKFVCVGTICAYPKMAPVPFKEDNLWDGFPEETNAPYAVAKRGQLVMLQAYRKQYGLNGIYLLPVNLYGPRDNFDPKSSHVIPALIRKCVEAVKEGREEIVVWGTGKATREFLYVDDAAEGILLAAERYDEPEPVNIGAGFEISIKELVEKIVELTGFEGRVVWDDSKPDGQPRRMLDTARAREKFGFHARKSFDEGLRETIAWYRTQAFETPNLAQRPPERHAHNQYPKDLKD